MTNKLDTVLYTGVTNNIFRRVKEHKEEQHDGFTKKYQLYKLVYVEIHTDIDAAIYREKQIKAGSRAKKISLIISKNPKWEDLSETLLKHPY